MIRVTLYGTMNAIIHNAKNMHAYVACRAWQRKLHSLVTDDTHKAEIYKYLWMLLTEGDKQVFSENLQSFIQYWEFREPKFTAYFRQNYAPRYGKKDCTGNILLIVLAN